MSDTYVMRTLRELPRATRSRHTCLVRVDLNMESPAESYRLTAVVPTIRFLRAKGYRIVLLTHRGRPSGSDSRWSVRPLLPLLKRHFWEPIIFLNDSFPSMRRTLTTASEHIFLLENLRFYPGEHGRDHTFAKNLASLGQLYVNDAFSVSHRRDASVVLLPRLLPSYGGLLLAKEIETLSRAFARSKQPLVLLVGGAKVPEKLGFIAAFRARAQAILVGGITANTLLMARGTNVGRSLVDRSMLPLARRVARARNIFLPEDYIVEHGMIKDIGPLTAKRFTGVIAKARTVIWNGPMGEFETPRFSRGSIAGGGETAELIEKLKLKGSIGFLSTGGGAMLEFLVRGTLPGIRALSR